MWVQSLGQEDPLGRHGILLQYSCLENPMNRGAWQTTVHRASKSKTQLKQLSMHIRFIDVLNVGSKRKRRSKDE